MKHPFRSHILPGFTLGAAGLGLALRFWLYSAFDEKALLPANHPAGILLFILSAATLGILYLATHRLEPGHFRNLPRWCYLPAGVLGCAGLVVNALTNLNRTVTVSGTSAGLSNVSVTLSILGGLLLVLMGLLEWRHKRVPYWLCFLFTLCLMVETVSHCQAWGAEPQLPVYFFPLMASVFLVLTAYHKTALLARKGKRVTLAFFSQAAAFFCCISFLSTHGVFYMGMFLWALFQLSHCLPRKKEA